MTSKTNKTISDTLKNLRKSSGMSQEQVSDILGIKRDTYASWEVARSAPKYDLLIKIAQLYKVSCEYILTGNDNQKFTVNNNNSYNQNVYSDKYVNELSNYEKTILMKIRLLNLNDKQKLAEYLENLNKD